MDEVNPRSMREREDLQSCVLVRIGVSRQRG
jgi:hypothetical protein